jgi:hypothetical protein
MLDTAEDSEGWGGVGLEGPGKGWGFPALGLVKMSHHRFKLLLNE